MCSSPNGAPPTSTASYALTGERRPGQLVRAVGDRARNAGAVEVLPLSRADQPHHVGREDLPAVAAGAIAVRDRSDADERLSR